ncbi:MAG: DUF2330 domain-containing protein, partial [Nitrospiraceae bacterium]|nr:DUF2330 domain-containing protein [Nitrospiraceae bacterium]
PLMNGGRILKNESSPVIVWETKKVEYYDLAVLSANDSHSLVNWLNQNGYHYPKEYDYILNDYIKNNWFFVAAKIDLDVAQNQNINQQIKTGHLIPLKISFATPKIVYPLRISSIQQTKIEYDRRNEHIHQMSSQKKAEQERILQNFRKQLGRNRFFYRPSSAGILIYIFAQHKQTLPKFNTLYANWVKADKIKNLAYDNQGNPWIKTKNQKYYLTKLYRRMNFSEMTYDLYPRQASNDQAVPYVPNVNHSSWKFYWLLTISGLLILVFLGWMGYEFKKNK